LSTYPNIPDPAVTDWVDPAVIIAALRREIETKDAWIAVQEALNRVRLEDIKELRAKLDAIEAMFRHPAGLDRLDSAVRDQPKLFALPDTDRRPQFDVNGDLDPFEAARVACNEANTGA
jgi:hypothetical protein